VLHSGVKGLLTAYPITWFEPVPSSYSYE